MVSEPATTSRIDQHLTLSVAVLALTTIGRGWLPFWPWLSLPGLLYLELHFIQAAYRAGQADRRVSIALNDAILMSGLLLTRQFTAGALFATLFWSSSKLQKQAEINLARYLAESQPLGGQQIVPAPEVQPTTPSLHATLITKPAWQITVDQGALPLLALSALSTPWLGAQRSLAVLLTNFGYDYRLTAPLSTLTYLKAANAQGIWLRNIHLLDQLQTVTALVLDVEEEEPWLDALQATPLRNSRGKPYTVIGIQQRNTAQTPADLVAALRSQGEQVAYLSSRATTATQPVEAEILIATPGSALATSPTVHVVLSSQSATQLRQLFALSASLHANRQRGFYLALIPGLLTLGGIYAGHLRIIAVLLIDSGAALAGIVNAALPLAQNPDRPAQ
ncbi:MAG: hypothetical protein KF832_13000 [Caldilineaceae bacterium]|nr:hypothetical protein [Caldilineaceae bacterium]